MLSYKGLFFVLPYSPFGFSIFCFYSLHILFLLSPYSIFTLSIFYFQSFHILAFIYLFIAQICYFCIILNKFCPLLNYHFPSLLINTSMFAYRTDILKL